MSRIACLLLLATIVAACQRVAGPAEPAAAPAAPVDTALLEQQLMELDREFDVDTATRGSVAWRERFADDGVVVQGSRTVIGPEAIGESMAFLDSDAVALRWQPLAATVSESGDLGFTRGTYRQTVIGDDGSERISTGSYLTIWQRRRTDSGDEWKIVLDTGSPDPPTAAGEREAGG